MSETGRFTVITKSGRKFVVEPIGPARSADWASKPWARGSIDPEDSIISEEQGFTNITILDKGISPISFIEMLDKSGIEKRIQHEEDITVVPEEAGQ